MKQKALIAILVVLVVVLGVALAYVAGPGSAVPQPMVPDDGQSQDEPDGALPEEDDSDVPDGAVDPDEGLDQPIPPAPVPDPGPSAGGEGDACLSNSDCAGGTYCAKSGTGACSASTAGTCQTPPDVCALVYSPVCGCDGKTYSNTCAAASAGMNTASQGACN